MILELDCGNSLIKWRVIEVGRGILAGGVADSDGALLSRLAEQPLLQLTRCRLVSVRTPEETEKLILALKHAFSIEVIAAAPARVLGGVENGYDDYQRLGLDRWLAVVGAFNHARKACLVIDLGTAVTSDFVDGDGRHLGGFICPGLPLMRNQLRTHTRRIRYDDTAAELALVSLSPGRSTAEAVERGCSLMLRGFVRTQADMAREYWGEDFSIFITGGDAALVDGLLPGALVVPDLIFMGLALACPFT